MPTAVENYIFNELPRRVVIDSSIATGSSFTESWVLVATGVGTQTIPTNPTALGFEPTVTPPGVDSGIKFWNGDKDWVEISAAAIGAIPTSEKGEPLGVATLDADGYVELSQMNPAVIERVVVVADEAARYALTTAQVQNGDVVNQQSPLPETMWYVVDDTNLDNSAGYLPFSAGVASSVAWSGITGKPAIIGDLEDIALAEEDDVIQYVAGEWVNVDTATLKTSLSISISDVTSLQSELDLKQSQSTVLDNLSAISTSGIVVRTVVGGDFIGRELVGINGIEVAEADGNGDNPTISLTETGVTAGTYGNEYEHPVVEVNSYGRVISITEASSSNKEVVYILDQPTTQLRGNTRHIFGGGVVTYSSNILLELPENVPGGTWVKILCAQNFSEASGTIGISATNPTTVQGTSLFDYTAFFKLYPFTVIDLVYSSSTNNWTLTTNATSFLSSLYVARQGATDGVSNSHAIISNATSPRSLNIPDRDVDLSSVGQTDFLDSTFRVSDNTDATKKIAFEASAISTGQTKTITMPNADVNLGLVGQTDFADNQFRISDNTDSTKKIAFEASAISTGQTKTITMPNADVNLGLVGQTDFADNQFRISDNTDSTKKIAFEASAISTGQTKTITMPNADVNLGLVGQTDFADNQFRISDNTDATKKIAFEASGIGTGQTKTITMPDVNVDLNSITSSSIASGAFVYTTGMGSVIKTLTAGGLTFNIDELGTDRVHSLTIRNGSIGNITCSFVSIKTGGSGSGLIEENDSVYIGSYSNSTPLAITLKKYESWEIRYGHQSGFVTYFTVKKSLVPLLLTSNLKFRNDLDTALGFTFAGTATGTDKVITLPNANVDLGNVAQAASTSTTGYLTSTDWTTFNGKQAALESGTNIKTINGNNILGSGNLSLFTPRVSTVTNPAYTLQTADNDGNTYLRVDTAGSATITIPSTHTTPITIRRANFQSVTLQGGSGVTLNGSLTFDVVGSTKSIIPIGTNQFDIVG